MDINWGDIANKCIAFGAMGTMFTFIVKAIIRDEINKLNDRFMLKAVAEQRFQEIEKHFDWIRDNTPGLVAVKVVGHGD